MRVEERISNRWPKPGYIFAKRFAMHPKDHRGIVKDFN